MKSFIEQARLQSLKSNFRQRVGACLVKNGKVISTGYNVVKHDMPLHSEHFEGSVHAEMMCIMRLIKKGRVKQIKGSTMYVVRTLRSNRLGLALPCRPCARVLLSLGCRSVVYSNDDDQGYSTLIL